MDRETSVVVGQRDVGGRWTEASVIVGDPWIESRSVIVGMADVGDR